jgi:fibronectin-binding autotransporter adhesin
MADAQSHPAIQLRPGWTDGINFIDMPPCDHSWPEGSGSGFNRRWLGRALLLALVLAVSGSLSAQTTLYWDTNGNTAGAGSSPSATWSTSNTDQNWSTSSAGTASTTKWTNGDFASFSAGTDATGSYTVTVSGAPSTAGIIVGEGSPTFTGGTLTFTGTSPGVQVASGSTATINSQIAGSNGLTKTGTGTLIVGNTANAYTGATVVSAGTLLLGTGNVIPDSSALSVASGATFDLNWSNNETVGSITGAGAINIRSNTFTVGGDNTSTTFSGSIGDSGAYGTLVKQGTGTLTLSGNNTYTGLTTINSGTIVAASSTALGGSTYGNTIATGAALQLQGGITLTEGSFSVSGTGTGGTGALSNLSGSNTLDAAVNLTGNTTISSAAGNLTVSGQVDLGSGNILTVGGSGGTDFSGAINNSSAITKTGSGTLTFSGSSANSFSGALNINDGTVVLAKSAGTNATGGGAINIGDGVGAAGSAVLSLGASNQIADYTSQLTVNSDGKFALNNFSEAVNTIAGTGQIDLGTSGYLNVGVSSGSSAFGGSITGTGTLEKSGSGTLTFNSSFTFSGTLLLSGGTVALNGNTLTVGTLHITGNTVIDFGSSSASVLNVSSFIIDSGAILTVTGWANTVDYFYAQSWSGAVQNTTGAAPMNQVVFSGYTASNTQWLSYGSQITPAPEPATYGAIFTGLVAALAFWRRRRPAA